MNRQTWSRLETRTPGTGINEGTFDREVEYGTRGELRANVMEVARFHAAEATSKVVLTRGPKGWLELHVYTVTSTGLEDFLVMTLTAAEGDEDPYCFRCGSEPRVEGRMLCEACEADEPVDSPEGTSTSECYDLSEDGRLMRRSATVEDGEWIVYIEEWQVGDGWYFAWSDAIGTWCRTAAQAEDYCKGECSLSPETVRRIQIGQATCIHDTKASFEARS